MTGFYSFHKTAKRLLKEKVTRKNAFFSRTLIKIFTCYWWRQKGRFFGMTFSFKSLQLVSRDRFFFNTVIYIFGSLVNLIGIFYGNSFSQESLNIDRKRNILTCFEHIFIYPFFSDT